MNLVLEYQGHTKQIIKFIISTDFIFSLAEEGEFIIFNAKTGAIIQKKTFMHSFEHMMHPTTYINKLLFAGGDKLELWNVIDDKLIYAFPKTLKKDDSITVIAQSPVLHTVALGYSSGLVSMLNLQTD